MGDKPTAEEHLGGTDARMEQDEFQLTASGWRELHGKRDARDMDPRSYTSSSRALGESETEVAKETEQAELLNSVAATDGGEAADE